MAESTISSALCGVMEQALIEKGVNPTLARTLAIRACEPTLEAIPATVAKVARRTSSTARASQKKLSKALKLANARLRNKNGSLRKGKTQSDVMKLAQRLKKKM